MSKTTSIDSQIDPALKARAEAVFAKFGLSADEAITFFYEQTVEGKSLPLRRCPLDHTPNTQTIAAMEAIDRGETTKIEGGVKGLRKLWDEL